MDVVETEMLYRAVGERVRAARQRQAKRLSQVDLANRLSISRASIVNIEAGRQHAPLSLLWQIAQQLDTELVALIPHRAELVEASVNNPLSEEMREQIRQKADGDESFEKELTSFIGQAVRQLTSSAGTTSTPRRSRKR